MEPSCVRQTLIPGTSALFADYLYDYAKVRSFFPAWYGDPESFPQAAAAVNFPNERRSALVSALRLQNEDKAALEALGRPNTVAVVTGQQVGLFSGPAYTIYKALTAVRLARDLSARGIEAVPVFWLATEDHDFAEVDHAWLFDSGLNPHRVVVEARERTTGPVGEAVIGNAAIDQVRSLLRGLPHADEVVQRLEHCYRPGATMGSAFCSFLKSVLSGLGLLFLDPLAPQIRDIAAPFLAKAAARIPELLPELRARNRDLEARGYHAQVNLESDSALLFALENGRRTPLRLQDGTFTLRGEKLAADPSQLAEALQARGAALSPNALLRPVMQDFLLPTIAYVGGPAEIAYMAQAEVLYRNLLGRMPVIFPRNSFTLLDDHASKILDSFELHVPDLLDHSEQVRARMAERLIPAALRKQLAEMRRSVEQAVTGAEAALLDFDPTLSKAAAKSRSKMLYQADKIAHKAAREALRRNQRALADAAYVQNLVYPERHLQERFYSIVPFLAKSGCDLPERLLAEAQVHCPDHMLRTV